AEPLAVLALIGEETGLVRPGRVGAELHPVLGDQRRWRGRRAAAGETAEVETLLLLHVLVGKAVEAAAGELFAQRVHDPFAVAERAGTEVFQHQQVAVAVDHQPADAVALAVEYTPGVGHLVELEHVAAQRNRGGDLAAEPAGVDDRGRVAVEHPQGDARMAVVETTADPLAVDPDHLDDRARLGALRGLVDQPLEDPRMGRFPGIPEADGRHVVVHRAILRGPVVAHRWNGEARRPSIGLPVAGTMSGPCTCPTTPTPPTPVPSARPTAAVGCAPSTWAWASCWCCWWCSRCRAASTCAGGPCSRGLRKACGGCWARRCCTARSTTLPPTRLHC